MACCLFIQAAMFSNSIFPLSCPFFPMTLPSITTRPPSSLKALMRWLHANKTGNHSLKGSETNGKNGVTFSGRLIALCAYSTYIFLQRDKKRKHAVTSYITKKFILLQLYHIPLSPQYEQRKAAYNILGNGFYRVPDVRNLHLYAFIMMEHCILVRAAIKYLHINTMSYCSWCCAAVAWARRGHVIKILSCMYFSKCFLFVSVVCLCDLFYAKTGQKVTSESFIKERNDICVMFEYVRA